MPSSKPALRHLFSIIVAIAFFFPILRLYTGFFQLLASILITYVVAKFNKGKSMPWMIFVYVVSFSAGNKFFDLLTFQDRDGPSHGEVCTKLFEMYQTFNSFFESHVIRAVYGYSYETIEITGPQMVLTMKLTTFAWNVYDGRRKVEVCLPTFPS
jgi:lysophospholipid acyltransferase